MTTTLTPDQLLSWGWRVPYVFGLLVGPAGLYIRSQMTETPQFLEAEKPPSIPIGDLIRRQPVNVLLALGASIVSNSSYYLLLYVPTYGVKTLHLPAPTGFIATLAGGIVLAIFSVVAGHYSDKTDRTRIMLWTGWLFLLASYPVFWMMVTWPSLASCVFAVAFLNLVKGGYSGVLPSLLSEQFPVETRAVGVAFSYSISVTVFGGFAPFVATWLISLTGDNLSPSYYLMATAERFAREGAHLVPAARTPGALEEVDDKVRAAGGTATLVPLDLRDFIKIDELAVAIYERYGRLDVLVGSAAEFGTFSPLGHIEPKLWNEIIDLNLTANWRLIRAMDPLLRAAPDGRAIFVTSGIARNPRAYWGPYAVSKAGLDVLVKTYAAEIEKTRVRANLIGPGVVRTRLRARVFPGEDPMALPPPESVADAFLLLALPECQRNGEIVNASDLADTQSRA